MSNAAIKGVLFDLDGTLLDTALDLGHAANVALAKFGYPGITDEQAYLYSSHGSKGLLKAGLGDSFHRTDITPMRDTLLAAYAERISHHTRPYDGIPPMLGYLDKNLLPWGIITNKPEGLARQLLAQQPELSGSAVLVGGDTLPVAKPDPAPLHLGAETLSLTPDSILYVGDAERDVVAANRAGMISVAALWGYISEEDQAHTWPAHHRCDRPEDLFDLIRDLTQK
ncbi:HAD family hydrolase [Ferrimonas sp.]|uniref:HAD family hydrolase n=1 Tax=Ferrimonas sp. TaxID=2080861 RepID=UPI003A91C89D